jgi:phage shock protein A
VRGLCKQPGEAPTWARSVSHMDLTIVPLANSWGRRQVEGGQFCLRTNEDKVDINRNWDSHWKSREDSDPPQTNPGAHAFSEPETRALRDLMHQASPHLFVSVHSGALGMYMPHAFNTEDVVTETQREEDDAKRQLARFRAEHSMMKTNNAADKSSAAAQAEAGVASELSARAHAMSAMLTAIAAEYGRAPHGSAGHELGYLCPGTCLDYAWEERKVPFAFAFEVWDLTQVGNRGGGPLNPGPVGAASASEEMNQFADGLWKSSLSQNSAPVTDSPDQSNLASPSDAMEAQIQAVDEQLVGPGGEKLVSPSDSRSNVLIEGGEATDALPLYSMQDSLTAPSQLTEVENESLFFQLRGKARQVDAVKSQLSDMSQGYQAQSKKLHAQRDAARAQVDALGNRISQLREQIAQDHAREMEAMRRSIQPEVAAGFAVDDGAADAAMMSRMPQFAQRVLNMPVEQRKRLGFGQRPTGVSSFLQQDSAVATGGARSSRLTDIDATFQLLSKSEPAKTHEDEHCLQEFNPFHKSDFDAVIERWTASLAKACSMADQSVTSGLGVEGGTGKVVVPSHD